MNDVDGVIISTDDKITDSIKWFITEMDDIMLLMAIWMFEMKWSQRSD